MGNQISKQFGQTPAPKGKMGGATMANAKGMPLARSANNTPGNKGAGYGTMRTRPITTGTPKPRHNSFGTVTKRVSASKG